MKIRLLTVCVATGLFLTAGSLYAGNGDLTVNGTATISAARVGNLGAGGTPATGTAIYGENTTCAGWGYKCGIGVYAKGNEYGVGGYATPSGIGVYGVSDIGPGVYGVSNNGYGVKGMGTTVGVVAIGTIGVQGGGTTYDFYANGSGVNYGPFTGGHDVKLSDDTPTDLIAGMVFSATGENAAREDDNGNVNVSSTLPTVAISNTPEDKKVFGVFVMETNLPKDHWYKNNAGERFAVVNAVGEGRVLVTNMNGDVNVGDYITTSSIAGYGQKQADDVCHSYTLGKATEKVDWDKIKKTVEFNGKKYKVYLIGVVYTSG